METLPVDLTSLVASIMGALLVLIPALGLAVRFAAKPVVDALMAGRGEGARPVDIESLKMRVDALEHEVRSLSAGPIRPGLPEPIPLRP
jgi:hypothetical protein